MAFTKQRSLVCVKHLQLHDHWSYDLLNTRNSHIRIALYCVRLFTFEKKTKQMNMFLAIKF